MGGRPSSVHRLQSTVVHLLCGAAAFGLVVALSAGARAAESAAGRIFTLDQVPAPVKVAILKEAGGEKIESAFVTLQQDPALYLAAVRTEQKSLLLEVAPEGKVVHIVIRRPQTLDGVPAAVKAAIRQAAEGATLRCFEATEENGRLSFGAELETREKSISLVLDRTGKILDKAERPVISRDPKAHENEPEIPDVGRPAELVRQTVAVKLDETPGPVKAAILKEAGGAEIQGLDRIKDRGTIHFRASWSRPGKETEVRFDPEGKVIGTLTNEKITLDQVDGAPKAAIQKELKDGKVEAIERVTNNGRACYMVKLTVGKKEVDLILDANGRVLRKDVSDAEPADDEPADKR